VYQAITKDFDEGPEPKCCFSFFGKSNKKKTPQAEPKTINDSGSELKGKNRKLDFSNQMGPGCSQISIHISPEPSNSPVSRDMLLNRKSTKKSKLAQSKEEIAFKGHFDGQSYNPNVQD